MKFKAQLTGDIMEGSGHWDSPDSWSVPVATLRIVLETARFRTMYRPVLVQPREGLYVVECEITDTSTDRSVTRIGELHDPSGKNLHPVTTAYDMAFQQAGSDMLMLMPMPDEGQTPEPEAQPDAEETADGLQDDDILLFGNMKGKPYGELKGTQQFLHFLDQLLHVKGLVFPEEAKNKQLASLLVLAQKEAS